MFCFIDKCTGARRHEAIAVLVVVVMLPPKCEVRVWNQAPDSRAVILGDPWHWHYDNEMRCLRKSRWWKILVIREWEVSIVTFSVHLPSILSSCLVPMLHSRKGTNWRQQLSSPMAHEDVGSSLLRVLYFRPFSATVWMTLINLCSFIYFSHFPPISQDNFNNNWRLLWWQSNIHDIHIDIKLLPCTSNCGIFLIVDMSGLYKDPFV